MKVQHANWIATPLIMAMIGCASHGNKKEATDPVAMITAGATDVEVGTAVEFNAAGSVYETLKWSINQQPVPACDNQEICLLTMNSGGSFKIDVAAITDTTQRASANILVHSMTASPPLAVTANSDSSFTPNQITGLKFWLDAYDPATLFTDNTCSTPVTKDGDPIGCWKDKKPGGTPYTVTQSIEENRPSYKIPTTNKPFIHTDGINDSLITAITNGTAGGEALKWTDYTLFIVVKPIDLTSADRGIFSCGPAEKTENDPNPADEMTFSTADPDHTVEWIRSSTEGASTQSFIRQNASTNFHLFSFRANAGTLKSWKNGGHLLSDTHADTSEMSPYKCIIGDRLAHGVASGTPGNNDYEEILLYNSALSENNRQQIENYLARKWGLTLSTKSFSPSDISGLSLWLDAADTTTLFTDSTCTTAVSADGNAVGCWRDKKGNGAPYSFVQATTPNKPTYKANTTNGLPTVLTDGNNDALSATMSNMSLNDLTAFMVININNRITRWQGVFNCTGTGSDSNSQDGFNIEIDNGQIQYNRNVGTNPITLSMNAGNHYDLTAIQLNSGTASLWSGGKPSSADTYTTSVVPILPTSCIIGAHNSGGTPVTAYANNNYAEIIIYNNALSLDDREQVESYLSTKWGVH